MIPLELLCALSIIIALTFYVLMAGADFGAGFWDLFSSGPREAEQRQLISDALAPIWEANHVWLILVVVVMFTAFPKAFAHVTTVMHVPLTIMLFGIVLRGSAFNFRAYDSQDDQVQYRWSRVFAAASLITPVMLGTTVGAISSGRMLSSKLDFVAPWFSPFPLAVGFFALSIFAFLAAVYLTVDAHGNSELQDDFRKRALVAQIFVAALAIAVFILAQSNAPELYHKLSVSSWTIGLHVLTAIDSIAGIYCLWCRKYKFGRLFAAGQATLILWGWGMAQFPFLIRPEFDIYNSSAPHATLQFLLCALFSGALLLFPSLYYLMRVFKQRESLPHIEH